MVEDSVGGIKTPAIMSTTAAGIITSLNRAAEQLLGIIADQVIGKATPVVFHDQTELDRRRESLAAQSGRIAAEPFEVIVAHTAIGRTVEAEWTYVHQRGHRVPVRLSVSALPDGMGKIVGYCIVAQDKRGQLQAEELLRRQAQLLDFVNDAIFIRDLERDTVTYWNAGAVRLYGWSSREAMGAYIHDFLRTRFPRPLEQVIQEFLSAGFWSGELVHTTRGGDVITVASRWTLLRDGRGVPSGSLELNTDITEQKRGQEALKAAHEELELRVTERTEALSEANERLRVLSRRLMEIQELERRAIARDLHDEIGQALTAIKLNLRELRTLPNCEPVEEQIADSLEILGQVLQRVRSLALDLRPSLLDELGLVPALRWYTGRQAERAGWDLQFLTEGTTTRPSPELEITCFRLAQEALTNIARHSKATKVEVRLESRDRELALVICDNGIGFDPESVRAGTSIGLSGMEERVRLVGGHFEIDSAPTKGTVIRALFPTGSEPNAGRAPL